MSHQVFIHWLFFHVFSSTDFDRSTLEMAAMAQHMEIYSQFSQCLPWIVPGWRADAPAPLWNKNWMSTFNALQIFFRSWSMIKTGRDEPFSTDWPWLTMIMIILYRLTMIIPLPSHDYQPCFWMASPLFKCLVYPGWQWAISFYPHPMKPWTTAHFSYYNILWYIMIYYNILYIIYIIYYEIVWFHMILNVGSCFFFFFAGVAGREFFGHRTQPKTPRDRPKMRRWGWVKTIGKPWENGGLMGFNGIFMDIHGIFMGYSWDIHGIFMGYTLWWTNSLLLKMAIEIVDFPIKNGGSFHSKMLVHQRVLSIFLGWRSTYCTSTSYFEVHQGYQGFDPWCLFLTPIY